MQAPVDIRYAGVAVARAVAIRDVNEGGLFVQMPDPLPVGTLVDLVGLDAVIPARVERVFESAAPDGSGMRLRPVGELGIKIEILGAPVALSADAPPALVRSADPIPVAPDRGGPRKTKLMFAADISVAVNAPAPAPAKAPAPAPVAAKAPESAAPAAAKPRAATPAKGITPPRAVVEFPDDLPRLVPPRSANDDLPEVYATLEKTPPPVMVAPPPARAAASDTPAPEKSGPDGEPLGRARPIEGGGKRARRRKR